MLAALANGADGTPPLFAAFVFFWDKVFGGSEVSLRLSSGFFVVLLVWHTSRQLLRRFPRTPAALALLAVLANDKFIFYAVQARFYGLVLFAFSLAFWSTVGLLERETVNRKCWSRHALACGLLWLSHPFGPIYSALLALLYAGFAFSRGAFSLARAAAFLGGPVAFLWWVPIFLVQRELHPVFPAGARGAGWREYWEFAFLASPLFTTLSLAGLVAILVRRRTSVQSAPEDRTSSAQLAAFALAFLLALNLTVALLDATGIIHAYRMLAVRYVLVAGVAYAVIFSATFTSLASLVRRFFRPAWASTLQRLVPPVAALSLVLQMGWTWRHWCVTKTQREPYLRRVAAEAGAQHLPLICESHVDAFFLATRTGASDVRFLLEDDFHSRTLMHRIREFYPQPAPLSPREFQRTPGSFVLVPFNRRAALVAQTPPP